jgi:hypothetical protein
MLINICFVKRKLSNIWQFFLTTLPVTVVFALAGFLLGGISGAVSVALTIGVAMSWIVKHYREQAVYQFYRNNGISRLQLWVGSYVLTFLGIVTIAAVLILINALS